MGLGLWYDLRNPEGRRDFESFYAEVLDQVAWSETLGFNSVWLTEHHFCDDGYTPSPLVVLAAIAGRTKKMRLGTNLMLPALHNQIRLAEDAASLAVLSGGRFDLGLGQGYRELEFEAFGQKIVNRPSLLEESIEILRKAFAGESLEYHGKRFELPDITISPLPTRQPLLLAGALSDVAIERVARIADGFMSGLNASHDTYLDALTRVGRSPAEGRIYAGQWMIVAEDPEREWAAIGDHAVYQLNRYVEWGSFPGQELFRDPQEVLDRGFYRLMDGPEAVADLAPVAARSQVKDIHFWAQLPGESVESGSRRLQYLASAVLSKLAAASRTASTPS
jgi:alkanesulfonate monooxygenase SsuD/methylene tetrahydromethanopterin reductase-like flavin-dependent oxidoreductase (luciferase family)